MEKCFKHNLLSSCVVFNIFFSFYSNSIESSEIKQPRKPNITIIPLIIIMGIHRQAPFPQLMGQLILFICGLAIVSMVFLVSQVIINNNNSSNNKLNMVVTAVELVAVEPAEKERIETVSFFYVINFSHSFIVF